MFISIQKINLIKFNISSYCIKTSKVAIGKIFPLSQGISDIIFNDEMFTIYPTRKEQGKDSIIATSIQHCTRGLVQ